MGPKGSWSAEHSAALSVVRDPVCGAPQDLYGWEKSSVRFRYRVSMNRDMRIISWNVNGLRACVRKGFIDWLAGCDAEIVALQEVRSHREQLPDEILQLGDWYLNMASAERKGYSGVALLSRRAPDHVETSLGEEDIDAEGRLLFARFGGLLIVNGYFPNGNGKNRDLSRIPYKLRFYRLLYERLQEAKERGDRILVMGDLNTAHQDIDLARPKQNRKTSGFRPEEREELDRWIRHGWIDTFRHFESAAGHYSWWSQRRGVRERNIGWRIDYILASPGILPWLKGAALHPEVEGSDHCPISVDLEADVCSEDGNADHRTAARPNALTA